MLKCGKKLAAKNVCVCVWERDGTFSATLSEIINPFLPLPRLICPSPLSQLCPPLRLCLPLPSLPPSLTVSISRRRALWGWGSVMVTMVPGGRYVCSAHAREEDSTNDREERILAVLGIIGTILNLLVVIIVYIYTSVT